MTSKADKLIDARLEIIDELNHCIKVALKYTEATDLQVVIARLDALNSFYINFCENKKELANYASKFDDDTRKELRKVNNELIDEYVLAKALLQRCIPEEEKDKSFSLNNSRSSNEIRTSKSKFKLPSIQIKPFSGDYQDWEEFRDVFEACFGDEDEKFTDCQKMLYLKSALKGEAYELIKSSKATKNKFKEAWSTLENRYQNTKKIFKAHVNAILDIPQLQVESTQGLKRVLDTANASLSAIETLGKNQCRDDAFIVTILEQKLDRESAKHWEESQKGSTNIPTYKQLEEFLNLRINILENIESQARKTKSIEKEKPSWKSKHSWREKNSDKDPTGDKNERKSVSSEFAKKTNKCTICEGEHKPFACPDILALTTVDRIKLVHEKKLCKNCLYKHPTATCTSKFTCRHCREKHNTVLHENGESSSAAFSSHLKNNSKTLLATAVVPVHGKNGSIHYLKALIDMGSTDTFITSAATQKLGLSKKTANIPISSINESTTSTAKATTFFVFGSLYDHQYRCNANALVISKISTINPCHTIDHIQEWVHILGLDLADPAHNNICAIDILLGADTYAEIVMSGLKKGPPGTPIAQQTKIGWILFGQMNLEKFENKTICNFNQSEDDRLQAQLQRFFETEEMFEEKIFTLEEQEIESKFQTETTVGSDGKFIIRLPFKLSPNSDDFLGNSYNRAYVRMQQLEKRLEKDENLARAYRESIQDAINQKHLRLCTPEEVADKKNAYFMPHHPVVKASSTTTKVRPVFDASAKSSNGFSLNDRLMIGPTVQPTIFEILIKWRMFQIAFTADIEKMYKQIWVHEDDAKFQRILWRNEASIPMQQFIATTVTFGIASAPFQATRVLNEIATIESAKPLAAEAITKNCYVDDMISGADTIEEAIQKRTQLLDALSKYGFNLRKFSSNSQQFVNELPIEMKESTTTALELEQNSAIKALGIKWMPVSDNFTFVIQKLNTKPQLTKRQLLSEVSKLFDPLGFASPITVKAKILLQIVCKHGIGWDEEVPKIVQTAWQQMTNEFHLIEKIQIPRWLGCNKKSKISIHAFCDASEAAYAALVYIRIEKSDGTIKCNLIASKTKVSPLKNVSLPRLELCGAVLLAKLVKKIQTALELVQIQIYCWSDSEIALAWITQHPSKWNTYEANRVAFIQNTIKDAIWQHVPSELNPADIASRGALPNEFLSDTQWWHGPQFISEPYDKWPRANINLDITLAAKPQKKSLHIQACNNDVIEFILNTWPNVQRACKITAWCLRWRQPSKSKPLTTKDINVAKIAIIKMLQIQYFATEYDCIEHQKQLPKNSTLRSLLPFMDEHGLLRVRGRIDNALIPYDQRHPMILPHNAILTQLIIQEAHIELKHSGEQATLRYVREKFWINRGRNTIKNILRKCVRCHRFNAKMQQQIMADLPATRVQPQFAFTHTGVDFAGPIDIKVSDQRNSSTMKGYICVFICLTTKAIHLELATDQSSSEFIECYKRFISIRGRPACMHSDHGRNFIGASHILPKWLIENAQEYQTVYNHVIQQGTQWKFIPPNAPHFGGIWEAAVKSTKKLLVKAFGPTRFTFKNMYTVLKQIEAILNSRPLQPLNEDPNEALALTPAHFLIGKPLTLIPEPSVRHITQNRLDIFQQRQAIMQKFWHEWSHEYLHQLQRRSKWLEQTANVKVGQIVLLHDQNSPPAQWKLARVIKIFPDKEGTVRVVRIKSGSSEFMRPIHKMSPLPIEENNTCNS